ncbi:phosphopantetheine-binding protein [Cryobacterium sp. SO2]|uniref:phosphopantetheine-binding protein n=1 Tax=Cryobacterium sp. SO2 TaxID=1897060 RepID=UPI00223DF9E2|nr:phosphopantetheine-binding protein [Cryobacterium sp. SO2]WEO77307.1 phosphopantetheine-binding protein [Cryobacterium sp. SO2]
MTPTDPQQDEATMLHLWSEVLQISSVGLDDDLIDIGGDSLTAMTLLSKITAEFGVELELWDLLDAGTPRRLLDVVHAAAEDRSRI